MKKSVRTANGVQRNVKNKTEANGTDLLVFTFADFHLTPINLKGQFNNFYNSKDQYVEKITILLNRALPLLSKEKVSLFTSEHQKANALHIHRVTGKRDVISQILLQYGFSEDEIDNMFEGESLYQLELPYANGATRIVFQRIDNIISFLFVDPNHHVYFNQKRVEEAGSLFYEYCPVNEKNECIRMNYLNTCFAFEFLDKEKYEATYDYSYSPDED